MLDDEQVASAKSGAKRLSGLTVAAAKLLVAAPVLIATPLLTVVPPSWKLYHKLHRWSAWQMQKASNADTLANVRLSNGQEDVRPAAWKKGGEDEKDRTGWKVKGIDDKRYDGAVHGDATTRMGKANIIHINEDDTEQGTWVECAMDNAFQADREQYLFRDATVQTVIDATDGPGQARADGGQYQYDISIESPGVHHDTLVPISSRAGYDGQVVSFDQYSNLKEQQSDQQTVRDAKNQAWAAAKLDDIEGRDIVKWAIIIGIWSAILLFHQDIGAFISGIGGSGGGAGTALGMLLPASLGRD